ncbi:MAG: molybdopterin-dependent oxidoreductase [Polyangiaceae bacterium]
MPTHHRTCNLCEALCGLTIETDGGRVTGIRGDAEDPFSRGHICPKGPAMRELQEDPDRLRHPLKRTPRGFERVSWESALDEIADRIRSIQRAHGRSAVATYAGNPTGHNHGAILMGQAFAAALHTKNKFDANSQDANPKMYVSHLMFGSITSLSIPDVDRTDLFLAFGANPLASNGSIMGLGDVRGRIKGIRARGARMVVVDPRRTETAKVADQHVAIRPGGDAAMILAMLSVMFREGLVDRSRVDQIATGLRALEEVALRFTPESVAGATGVDAATITELARAFARARRAVAYGRVGVCLNEFGAVASWLVEALNVVTGNFDRDGGAMFTKPAIDLAMLASKVGVSGVGRFKTRVRGLPEVGGMFPAAAIAEEIETPGAGQIRGLVTIAGNPVLSVPNGERLAAALDRLELLVSVDFYLNETTRHAHFILPPRFALEREHYDLLFNALAVRNVAKYSPVVIPPADDTRDDWTILYELAIRLAARKISEKPGRGLAGRAFERAARAATPSPDRVLDVLLRIGPYRSSLAKLRASPHGIDFGPLVPMGRERVRTKDGKVDLAPAPLVADVPRVESWARTSARPELVLIGRRHLRSNNSWMHNLVSLTKGPSRASLLMNPGDARARGLESGARVRVKSRVGAVEASVELTDDVGLGVVSLPHGFGHAVAKDTMRVAGALEGPNMNAITDDHFLEPLTGTAILNGVPVVVEAIC